MLQRADSTNGLLSILYWDLGEFCQSQFFLHLLVTLTGSAAGFQVMCASATTPSAVV